MSLFGKLEDTPLQELLQVMAASQVTGKLRLTGRDREGIVVFRNGNIVYAASSGARQTLGNLLLLQGLVSEHHLSDALDRQHAAKEELRLGRAQSLKPWANGSMPHLPPSNLHLAEGQY